jgi:hypothetical protein
MCKGGGLFLSIPSLTQSSSHILLSLHSHFPSQLQGANYVMSAYGESMKKALVILYPEVKFDLQQFPRAFRGFELVIGFCYSINIIFSLFYVVDDFLTFSHQNMEKAKNKTKQQL